MLLPASHSRPVRRWRKEEMGPTTPEAANEPDALPVAGFQGTPEEIERQWYEHVYRGRGDRMSQLTRRAVLMGSALGGVLSVTNLLYRPQGGLGLRCGDHGVHPLVCHLDHTEPGRHRAHPHDHPREQLYAVDGELGWLLDRRHAHFRLRGLHVDHQQHLAAPGDARLGVLPRGARCDHGDPNETADAQHRATSFSHGYTG